MAHGDNGFHRTGILCPECFKKKILTEDKKEGYCDECGTEFIILDYDRKSLKYK